MVRLFEMKNTIDDTPRVVARHFLKTMRPQAKLAKVEKTVQRITKPTKKVKAASKRDEAWSLFVQGFGANEVAVWMEITYANSHYYLRALRKAGGDIGQEVK